ncbi:MAG: LL-diaminopimelate aminotransferase [Archaeoglobaceae archaeon]
MESHSNFPLAERLNQLPPYLFAELDVMKKEKQREGVDVIDFGVGDPDLATPSRVVEAMQRAVEKVENQKYPDYAGMTSFKEAVADFYQRRKKVKLDPEKDVIALIGSKEGIAHLPMAFVEPGDYVLVPDPHYPVYYSSTVFAGGNPYIMPLKEENGFLPYLQSIPEDVAKKAKIMFLNYPNNPTSGVAEMDFIKEAVDFCRDNKIILAQDAAYSDVSFDYRVKSFMEVEGAMDVVIEFNSLSKTYNMTGWRIGMAVGNHEALNGLLKVKTNIDSGTFHAVQEAGVAALSGSDEVIEKNNQIYKKRRDILVDGLKNTGLDVNVPKATFYLWCGVPPGYDSISFTKKLLDDAGVLVTPGVGFGEYGDGFVRFALTRSEEITREAVERITQAGI